MQLLSTNGKEYMQGLESTRLQNVTAWYVLDKSGSCFEHADDVLQIKETQKQIKKVLQDRWTAWYEARDLWNNGVRPGQDQVSKSPR